MPDQITTAADFHEACRKVVDYCIEQVFAGYDIDGGGMQDRLEELGLIVEKPGGYDPETDYDLDGDFEDGDKVLLPHAYFGGEIMPYTHGDYRMFVQSFRGGVLWGDKSLSPPDSLRVVVQGPGGKQVDSANYRKEAEQDA